MHSEFIIRPATPADAPALCAIYNSYVATSTATFDTEPITPRQMRRLISRFETCSDRNEALPFLVAETHGAIAGYCYAHPWKTKSAYSITLETTIYLAPSYCGRGIGRALMTQLIDRARVKGYRSLIACITADNAPSIAFHLSFGFIPVSHFKAVGSKFGQLLDITDLQLLL